MTADTARGRIANAIACHIEPATAPRVRVRRVWFDVHVPDCDCGSADGVVRLTFVCEACADTHGAAVCIRCAALGLDVSHEQPLGLRSALRRRALEAVSEARP